MPKIVFNLIFVFCLSTFVKADDSIPGPIKIGVISSLDPIVAPWSQSANLGIEQAVGEINESGGIKGRSMRISNFL